MVHASELIAFTCRTAFRFSGHNFDIANLKRQTYSADVILNIKSVPVAAAYTSWDPC